jgi:hypothetical protein
VDLITAAEAPPVDGFTVQQYLSEVERSITDPTLTSTIFLIKSFLKKPKPKSKVYSSLMESLKEMYYIIDSTITNSSGQTAFNLFLNHKRLHLVMI